MPIVRRERPPFGLIAARLLGPLVTILAVGLLVYAYRLEPTPGAWLLGNLVVGLVATPLFLLGVHKQSPWFIVGFAIWLHLASSFMNYHFLPAREHVDSMWAVHSQSVGMKGLPVIVAISLCAIFWLDWLVG